MPTQGWKRVRGRGPKPHREGPAGRGRSAWGRSRRRCGSSAAHCSPRPRAGRHRRRRPLYGPAGKAVPFPAGEGELRVYKSRARVCAVTVASRPGERRRMAVSVQPRGGVPVADAGRFTRYAGPVTVGAISRCVYVRGNVAAGSADSGWILC
ncbi:hypothetical protein ACFSNO_31795 [Streptomyces cirratus]